MFNKWLKPYLPRSLFGRAFLILIVPIVVIQVVVGIVFVERLFQDVTRQMTRSMIIDLGYLMAQFEQGNDITQASRDLEIWVKEIENPVFDAPDLTRDVFDISGKYAIETLHSVLDQVRVVDLQRQRGFAYVLAEVAGQGLEFSFSRQRISAANPHQLLVYMILTAALFSTIAALFLRNQISPIRRLAKAADAFGKGQNVVLHPRGASEVRSAASAFLSMRARIERQIEQRTLMLSGVSHDLRTPLTRMKLSLSLMDQNEETQMIDQDLDEMTEILDEFLAFARGDSEEQIEQVSPRSLIEQLVQNANRNGANISLEFEGASNADTPIRIRRPAVQRALSNLLSNAKKYGEIISVTVYVGAGFIEFYVEDDGPGIRPDQRDDAIKPFARLDEARNQNKGSGVGLGLAIAADIARSHGGTLTLSDSAKLGGLKAAFRIPR